MKRDALGNFLRDLGGLYRAQQVYPTGNQLVWRAGEKVVDTLSRVGHTVRIARLGTDVVAEERTLEDPPTALCSLLERLSESGWEGMQVDPEVTAEELVRWVQALVSEGQAPEDIRHIRVGTFHLESPGDASASVYTEAAAGYLTLTPGVEDALSEMADEKSSGLSRARDIVRSIAGHMAAGEGLFNPIRSLKTHDDYTFTHALNVCVISAAVARECGVPEREVDRISLAALCHDIGKEKVPQEILNKDGPLTEEEKKIMDRHPIQGAQMLLTLHESVDPLLPIVSFQHHLGADGSGYPERPAFERIHPVSLLVAVADTYDALRTVRSYQKPRSAADAVNVMLEKERQGAIHLRFLGAFVRCLGLLEPGSEVTLQSGRRAVIEEERPDQPLRPRVVTQDGERVDLSRLLTESILQVHGSA